MSIASFLRKRSLVFKMTLFIGVGVLVTFFTIFAYSYVHAKQVIGRNIETNAGLEAQKAVGTMRTLLLRVEKVPGNLSVLLSSDDYTDEKLFSLLRKMMDYNQEIYGMAVAYEPYTYKKTERLHSPYIYREQQSIKTSYLGGDDYDYPLLDWFQIPRELDSPYWSEPYFDESGGNILMSTFSVPFYRLENGKKVFRGVVTADISLEGLVSVITGINAGQTGYCFVISRTGTLVSHPNKDYIMHESLFSLADERQYSAMRDMGLAMMAGVTGKADFNYVNLQTGKVSWIFFAPIATNGWSVGVVYPVDELFTDITFLSKFILLLGIAGGSLLIVIIIYVSNSITKPIRTLADATKLIAAGDFAFNIRPLQRQDEVGELNHSFIAMQGALQYYIENLKKTTSEIEKIESELRIAHEIQMSIIPKLFPPFPDRKELDLYADLIPVKEVGGDLYDFFFVDDDHLVIAVGDVSGKGVPASLFMAVTRTLLRAKITRGMKANEIVRIVNEDLCKDNTQKMFVTFFLAILDVVTGEFEYCNAGHNPPYLMSDGALSQFELFHGYPLGIQSGGAYKSASLKLKKNDTVVCYTDGITEAESATDEMFEEMHLEQLLQENITHTAEGLTKRILAEVKSFSKDIEQSDDITLLVLKYLGDGAGRSKKSEFFKYSILVKQNIEELVNLQHELDSLFTAWHIKPEVIEDFLLAFEELVTNIIFYAFNDEKEHIITVRINFDGETISAQLEDDGIEFNPLNAEDPTIPTSIHGVKPGGMGIFLCKKILHGIEYHRIEGKNILSFTKSNE